MLSLVKDVPYTPVKRETSVEEEPSANAEQSLTPKIEKPNLL
jgi:hypothetical protein